MKRPTVSLTVQLSEGRKLILQNRENVEREALHGDALVAHQARERAPLEAADRIDRRRRHRETLRERGEELLRTWAHYRAWAARGMGYPPENVLAKMMPRLIVHRAGADAREEYVPLTLTERQAQAYGQFMQIDMIISNPDFPGQFRDVIRAVHVQNKRQAIAAAELGISQTEFSISLQQAKEHLAHQYDYTRPIISNSMLSVPVLEAGLADY